MEKKRGNQVMAIAALFIAVIGLSLGFAAFSNTLTISSSATVTPDSSEFDVDFSNISSAVQTTYNNGTSDVDGVATVSTVPVSPAANTLTYTRGVISNSVAGAPTITGLSAAFTEPGQSVTYTFYTYNAGHLVAYLREINFGSTISCSVATTDANNQAIPAAQQATDSLVQTACADMELTVAVKNSDGTAFSSNPISLTTTNTTNASTTSISGKNLAVNGAHQVSVTIAYTNHEHFVDGRTIVTLPNIQLVYKSLEASEEPAQNNGN